MNNAAGHGGHDEDQEEPDDTWYICLTCNRAFVKDSDLGKHRKVQHGSRVIKVLMIGEADLLPSIKMQQCRMDRKEFNVHQEVNTVEIVNRGDHHNATRSTSVIAVKPKLKQKKTEELPQNSIQRSQSGNQSWRKKALIFSQNALLPTIILQKRFPTSASLSHASVDLSDRSHEHHSTGSDLELDSVSTSRLSKDKNRHMDNMPTEKEQEGSKNSSFAATNETHFEQTSTFHVLNAQEEMEPSLVHNYNVASHTTKRKSNNNEISPKNNKISLECQQKRGPKKDKRKSSKSAKFKCKLCFKRFFGIGGLKSHIFIMHVPHKQSDISTSKVEDMEIKHVENVDATFPLDDEFTEIENDFTETTSSDNSEEQIDSSNQIIKQEYSGNKIVSAQPEQSQEKVFECEFCSCKYYEQSNLQSHAQVFHSEPGNYLMYPKAPPMTESEYEYEACVNAAASYTTEEEIENTKTIRKIFQCGSCNENFDSLEGMNTHIVCAHLKRTLAEQNPQSVDILCSICGKLFTSRIQLHQHQKFHNGKKQQKRKKSSVKTTSLKNKHCLPTRHQPKKAYSDLTTPFKCPECNKYFKHNASLRRHCEIHSSVQSMDNTCLICQRQYSRKDCLNRHIISCHNKDGISSHKRILGKTNYRCKKQKSKEIGQTETYSLDKSTTFASLETGKEPAGYPLEKLTNMFVNPHLVQCAAVETASRIPIQLEPTGSLSTTSRILRPRTQQTSTYFEHDSDPGKAVSTKDADWSDNEGQLDVYDPVVSSDTDDGLEKEIDKRTTNKEIFTTGKSEHKMPTKLSSGLGLWIWNCQFCPCRYQRKKPLYKHLKQFHADEKGFVPSIPELVEPEPSAEEEVVDHNVFNNSEGFKNDNVNPNKQIFSCGLCGNKFATSTLMNYHIIQEHLTESRSKPFTCEICGKQYRSSRNLAMHNSVVHDNANRKDFLCKICGMSFKNGKAVKGHSIRVHGEKKCACDICGRPYATTKQVEQHKESHKMTTELKFICFICGKPCKRKTDLTNHMISHSTDRSYKCTETACTASFNTGRSLRLHVLTRHGDLRPHQCSECGKCFKLTTNLKRHSRTHDAVRKHVCEICSASFKTGPTLRRHQTSHKQPLFECKVCNRKFTQKAMLQRHANFHLSDAEKKFECSVCGKKFGFPDKLRQHEVSHQNDDEKKYQCTICGKKFGLAHHLKQHMPTHNSENSNVGRKSRTGDKIAKTSGDPERPDPTT